MASPTAAPNPSPSSPRSYCYHWCTGTASNFNGYFRARPISDHPSSSSSIGSDLFVVLFCVLCAALLVLCYYTCCASQNDEKRRRLSIQIIKHRRGRARGVVESTECAVCLTEFTEEENLRRMPNCQHAFHPPCIDAWLRSHYDCPICRAPMTAPPLPSAPPVVVSQVRVQRGGRDVVVVVVDADRRS